MDIAVEEVYGRLLENPTDPEANGDLAKVLHRLGQYPAAELLYSRAYLLDPESFRWPYYVAQVRALEGRHDLAASSLRQALALDSTYLPAWLALGEAAFRAGDTINSTEAFENLGDEGPAGALAAYWLGRLALERRDWDGEVDHLSRAVQLAPAFGAAQYALGIRYKEMSREPDARRHLVLAQQHRLDAPQLEDPLLREVYGDTYQPMEFVREGQALLSSFQVSAAMAAFQRALVLGPDTIQARAGLIQCYGRLHRLDDAEGQFREAIAINEDFDQPYVYFGAVLMDQNRFQEASEQFAHALEANPYDSEALAYTGYLSEQDGDFEGAIRSYRRALEYKPTYALARVRVGAALLRLHRNAEASREFDGALENPGSSEPRVLYQIGLAYSRVGESSAGEAYFERAEVSAAEHGQSDIAWEEAGRWPLD